MQSLPSSVLFQGDPFGDRVAMRLLFGGSRPTVGQTQLECGRRGRNGAVGVVIGSPILDDHPDFQQRIESAAGSAARHGVCR